MISPRELDSLTDRDRTVVGQCLRAAAEGPFFADEEFATLLGLERERVADVAARWPEVDLHDDATRAAVNNALVNLAGYSHGREGEWPRWISAAPDEVSALVDRLRLAIG